MKKLLFISFSIIVTTIACRAQKPVAKLTSNQVIIHNTTFKIVRGHERVQIINSKNKLTNVQMITPKLPSDVRIAEYARYDKNILIKICAAIIPLSTLQKLPKGFGDWIFITFKVEGSGKILEMEFLLKNTSLVSANEIKQIEEKIYQSQFKIKFINGVERYFTGANYFNIDTQLQYSEMLKAKLGN